ncbi:MAG TPA: N-acyl homoserine lactonase family protein [Steroidobacteraceae bacterium]|nr:N-acyl homoserine lactonase family protein [Steroidobacteraceae bacterium]
MEAVYEICAVRYAHLERTARHNFIGGDEHDGPMPLDYYVWVIRGAGQCFVLDTGFEASIGAARGRQLVQPVEVGLRAVGVDPAAVTDVIISHMHYDHAGNHELFPRARYHLQTDEMAHCTGSEMCHAAVRATYEVGDVQAMIGKLFAGRVVYHEGAAQLAPGISVHRVGGHTRGLQVVRVRTQRGWVVLASDAMHFYANWQQRRPFPIVDNVATYLDAFGTIEGLASSNQHVIPGHDPLVLQCYPAARAGLANAVRVDLPPTRPVP